MKIVYLILVIIVLFGCRVEPESNELTEQYLNSIDWRNRSIDISGMDSLESGKSYLSVNSVIYSSTQHSIRNLTVTVSLRNTDEYDTIYMGRVDFFDTDGRLLKKYTSSPVFLKPMETIEIVISQNDPTGGSGGNFIFEWKTPPGATEPVFESVMLSVMGNNAFAYATHGWRIE